MADEPNLFLEALTVSCLANIEALLISAAGVVAMACKVIQPTDMKVFARLIVKILFPCLTFSNFRVFSAELISRWYVSSITSVLTIALGALLGRLGAFLLYQ